MSGRLPPATSLHLGETPFEPDGTFTHGDVTVTHPERAITMSEGCLGRNVLQHPRPGW